MKQEFILLTKNRKHLEEEIGTLTLQIESKKKFINMYTETGDKTEQKKLEKQIIDNEEKIGSINSRVENYRAMALKAY